MIDFKTPYAIFFVFLPILFFKVIPSRSPQQHPVNLWFPNYTRILSIYKNSTPSSDQNQSSILQKILLMLSWTFLCGALMQPYWVNHATPSVYSGHDLLLAVDLSRSMDALDFNYQGKTSNRLSATKHVISDFISQRQGDRIGLIVFGEYAYLTTPLTFDIHSLNQTLQHLQVGMAGNSTAIGDAIGIAIHKFKKSTAKHKILVLLTDGEDTASHIPPLEAAKLAKSSQIKIHTIAIGQDGIVPIKDPHGYITKAYFKVDETLLKEIADITHGTYSKASDTKGLSAIYDKINTLEKTNTYEKTVWTEDILYRIPLLASIACLMLSLFTNRWQKNYDLA